MCVDWMVALKCGLKTKRLTYSNKRCGHWLYTEKKSSSKLELKLECGPMPNAMATLPNIGGALCSTPQSLADAHYCSAVQ